tara:strand:- start:313 stop:525 length:213 start_codon:yes stop_codon:yes gene_type:complete
LTLLNTLTSIQQKLTFFAIAILIAITLQWRYNTKLEPGYFKCLKRPNRSTSINSEAKTGMTHPAQEEAFK